MCKTTVTGRKPLGETRVRESSLKLLRNMPEGNRKLLNGGKHTNRMHAEEMVESGHYQLAAINITDSDESHQRGTSRPAVESEDQERI